jgi:ribonuclease VapC
MVIDTSAVLAILLDEPERRQFNERIAEVDTCLMSAVSLVEAGFVIEARSGEAGGIRLDRFVRRARIEIVAVDQDQAEFARTAWRRFGKGRHPAALSFGDCFAYALAKATGEPLLFKGNDFVHTDIVPAWPPP